MPKGPPSRLLHRVIDAAENVVCGETSPCAAIQPHPAAPCLVYNARPFYKGLHRVFSELLITSTAQPKGPIIDFKAASLAISFSRFHIFLPLDFDASQYLKGLMHESECCGHSQLLGLANGTTVCQPWPAGRK